MNKGNTPLKHTLLATAVTAALGAGSVINTASAVELVFNWDGKFTMLDSTGEILENTSKPNGVKGNNFQTDITGTLTYDTVTGTGTATIATFDFFNGSLPADAQAISFVSVDTAIGNCKDGAGVDIACPDNLLLANMLFNWNGNTGIPVSLAWDMTGLANALPSMNVGDTLVSDGTDIQINNTGTSFAGSTPASDGSYTNGTFGYLALGPVPVATTLFNTTNGPGCTVGGCDGVNPSGIAPLLTDTAENANQGYYTPGNTLGIGGNPMQSGPFQFFSANFDIQSIQLVSDGSGPAFTQPTDITVEPALTSTPTTFDVDLGTVTDEAMGVTVEYSVDGLDVTDGGKTWITDDGTTNTETFDVTETVNVFTVDWRATDGFGSSSFATQTVTIDVDDTTPPVFNVFPADVTVNVASTADTIIFEGPGSPSMNIVAASDAVEPNVTIEYSLDGFTFIQDTASADESANTFGPGDNTVVWRVTDVDGNVTSANQTVTLNLPTGVVGQPCTIDPDVYNASIGDRLLEGSFIMRDPAGGLVGNVDNFVTGRINSADVCADETCTLSGADLESPTPFFGELWTTNTIRLFNTPGTYTFETCLADGSIQCTNPTPLSMTVGSNQLGAHMLFDWSVNTNIDVVVVWDFGCGDAELVTSDPDGDGILGTKMVDGPFKGFNAAFDIKTQSGSQALTTGGFAVTTPALLNPTSGASPLVLGAGSVGTTLGGNVTITADQLFTTFGASRDGGVVTSCKGGCFDFEVTGVTGSDITVVLPLSEEIPFYTVYRKYDSATDTWSPFVVDANNSVKTAPKDGSGMCPEPGAGDYSAFTTTILEDMLRPGDECIQLVIEDNGPNDSNPALGTIADPSGGGVTAGPSAPTTATSGGGGCSMTGTQSTSARGDWWLLAGFLAWLGVVARRKQQQ